MGCLLVSRAAALDDIDSVFHARGLAHRLPRAKLPFDAARELHGLGSVQAHVVSPIPM